MTKPKLNKTEQKEAAKYEAMMRRDVEKLKAVDELSGGGNSKLNNALEKARETYRALKLARGEEYNKEDIKEFPLPPQGSKKSGNR